jgi:hypothetical protein
LRSYKTKIIRQRQRIFYVEDEGQVNCDEKGPDLLTGEIYALTAEL